MKKYKICLIGASGLVGERFIKILNASNFPIEKIYLYSTSKNAGKRITVQGKLYKISKLTNKFAKKVNFTFFATNDKVTLKYLPYCSNNGYVIDNSSALRNFKNIPLVIPEINADKITPLTKIISNPNCTTAICAIPLFILNEKYKVESINLSSYQSISGMGKNAVNLFENNNLKKDIKFASLTNSCIPKIGYRSKLGYTEEEQKFIDEMRKILNNYELKISATCVRVPVKYCHGACLQVRLKNKFSINEIKKEFKKNKGIKIADNLNNSIFPTADKAFENEKVIVGRIRRDLSNENTLLMFIYGDNLMRGASYNAFKIMEILAYDRL